MKRATMLMRRSGKVLQFVSTLSASVLMSLLLILTGCSSYQYISVSSRLPVTESKEYVVENDTVLMKYSFAGANFPLSVTIFNKLSRPLYFDMNRSTVVINGIQSSDAFYAEGQISFIAPGANATVFSNPMRGMFLDLSKMDSSSVKRSTNNLGTVYSFDEETTPLYFRCILALTVNDDYSYPTFYDYSFWVSDVLKTVTGPKNMPYNPSNQFYIGKTNVFGKTVMWTGFIALTILGGMAAGE
jgi:membrane-bound inhibitor of C-type lysozyme